MTEQTQLVVTEKTEFEYRNKSVKLTTFEKTGLWVFSCIGGKMWFFKWIHNYKQLHWLFDEWSETCSSSKPTIGLSLWFEKNSTFWLFQLSRVNQVTEWKFFQIILQLQLWSNWFSIDSCLSSKFPFSTAMKGLGLVVTKKVGIVYRDKSILVRCLKNWTLRILMQKNWKIKLLFPKNVNLLKAIFWNKSNQ